MEKRKNSIRFLKNRNWKSKFSSRLKGNAKELFQEFQGLDPSELKFKRVTTSNRRWPWVDRLA
jgi:CRISPR/Cas system endoribonuclease Cas6 (RAMP superfamily)